MNIISQASNNQIRQLACCYCWFWLGANKKAANKAAKIKERERNASQVEKRLFSSVIFICKATTYEIYAS
jgi:hypothetical protein